jgi:hypothetical protein
MIYTLNRMILLEMRRRSRFLRTRCQPIQLYLQCSSYITNIQDFDLMHHYIGSLVSKCCERMGINIILMRILNFSEPFIPYVAELPISINDIRH